MFSSFPRSPDEFRDSILSAALHSLKMNTYSDNFDSERFNYDGNDRSSHFSVDERVFHLRWFFEFFPNLFNAFQHLNDAHSKTLFLYLITYRLAGHLSVKIPVPFVSEVSAYQQYKNTEKWTESSLPVSGLFGKLKHYDFEYDGRRYIADCISLEYCLFRKQYFYSRDGVDISPRVGDNVIDGGACTGDTTAVFSNVIGPEGTVYAFDPVEENLNVLEFNIKQFPFRNVKAMPYGLSDRHVDSAPVALGRYDPGFRARGAEVPLRSLDELVDDNEIERIGFVKLDVEGSELETLVGAKKCIRQFRPSLAVSIYHKPNDLFEIIEFISQEFPFYKLYIDHYTIHQEETVLYCTL